MKNNDTMVRFKDGDEDEMKPRKRNKVKYVKDKEGVYNEQEEHDEFFRGRDLTCCFICFTLVIALIIYFCIFFTTGNPIEKQNVENFISSNLTIIKHDNLDSDLQRYHSPNIDSCVDPYESVCKEYKDVSLFEKGDKLNKLLVKKMDDTISKEGSEVFYRKIHTHMKKEDYLEIQKVQNITQTIRLFFKKCMNFSETTSKEKINIIYNNQLFKELIQDIHDFTSFSHVVGKLSKHNIETPITIDFKPFIVNKNTFETAEIYSVEPSGDPLFHIEVDRSINEYKKRYLRMTLKKITKELLHLLGHKEEHIIFRNHRMTKDFLKSCGIEKNYKRNVENEMNIVSYEELDNVFKNFNFKSYLDISEFKTIKYSVKVNINNIKYFQNFDNRYRSISQLQWKHYFIINLIYSFLIRTINISGKIETKIEKCIRFTKEYYPISTCRIFKHYLRDTEHYGSEEIMIQSLNTVLKGMIEEYIEKINYDTLCLKERISKDDIIKKLRNIKIYAGKCSIMDKINRIAYTSDNWLEMVEKSEYSIGKDFIQNNTFIDVINEFNQQEIFKLERHTDFELYYKDMTNTMTELNAWFDNYFNIIVIPPGFLVYPFYSEKFNSYQLWSVLTVIAGHEIFHAVKHYLDHSMVLKPNEKECMYQMKTEFIKLYECHKMDVAIDFKYGKRTLDENLADFFGLEISFKNWLRNLKDKTHIEEKTKRFFLNYLQIWCKDSDYYYDNKDMHATSKNRAIIPLLGTFVKDHFERTFNCTFKSLNKMC